MDRLRKWCWVALALGACGPAAADPSATPAPVSTTTTAAPTTTSTPTTAPPPPPTTAAPRPAAPVTTAAPRVAAPPTTRPPVVHAPSGHAESCGWAWDATRVDDGSLNEVTIMLDTPRRPNEAVTLTVKPGASLTSTPAVSRQTSTDADGQSSALFPLSNDRRDWTLTVSASFASGGVCAPQTFTLEY